MTFAPGTMGGHEPSHDDWNGTQVYGEYQQRNSRTRRQVEERPPHLQLSPNYNMRMPPSPTSSQHSAPLPSPNPDSPSESPTNWSRPRFAPRSVSESPYRANSDASPRGAQPPRASEASRLRTLKLRSGQRSGRQTPEMGPAENFSRPRKQSILVSDGSSRPALQSANTFPRQQADEPTSAPQMQILQRDSGTSVSSSASSFNYSVPLRASASIPEFQTTDHIQTRQRNLSNGVGYRIGRTALDGSALNARRELPPRSNGVNDEEVRASFKSALTGTSSLLGTSGTERSSVLTKSSSATSIFGREEGMSVDDAIGMYENGFQDSDMEGGHGSRGGSRPATRQSQRSADYQTQSNMLVSHHPPALTLTQSYAPHTTNLIVRDSAQIFSEPYPRSAFDQADDERTPRHLQHPTTSHSMGTSISQLDSNRPTTGLPDVVSKFDDTRDRYGFKKVSHYINRTEYDAWNGPYTEHLMRRRKKWDALMREAGLTTNDPEVFPPRSTKVKRFVRKGIPPAWRGAAWFHYAGGKKMLANHPGLYDKLLQRVVVELPDEAKEQIERDLHRTFPDNICFKPDPALDDLTGGEERPASQATFQDVETPILHSLRRILQAFAVHQPRIGYCQSLNFLAGLLLLFIPNEEKAFWMLVIITQIYLPETHGMSLEGANVDLGVLMISIKESMPAIWAKIGGELDGSTYSDINAAQRQGISTSGVPMRLPPITLCCTAWFMSCFIGTLPIETTLRVWDTFFYEGSKTMFRIALAIFKAGEGEIRAINDPMEVFQTVQTIPRKMLDANELMEACYRRRNGFGHLSQELIEARRKERRDGYSLERAIARGDKTGGGREGQGRGGLSRTGTLFKRGKKKAAITADTPAKEI